MRLHSKGIPVPTDTAKGEAGCCPQLYGGGEFTERSALTTIDPHGAHAHVLHFFDARPDRGPGRKYPYSLAIQKIHCCCGVGCSQTRPRGPVRRSGVSGRRDPERCGRTEDHIARTGNHGLSLESGSARDRHDWAIEPRKGTVAFDKSIRGGPKEQALSACDSRFWRAGELSETFSRRVRHWEQRFFLRLAIQSVQVHGKGRCFCPHLSDGIVRVSPFGGDGLSFACHRHRLSRRLS